MAFEGKWGSDEWGDPVLARTAETKRGDSQFYNIGATAAPQPVLVPGYPAAKCGAACLEHLARNI